MRMRGLKFPERRPEHPIASLRNRLPEAAKQNEMLPLFLLGLFELPALSIREQRKGGIRKADDGENAALVVPGCGPNNRSYLDFLRHISTSRKEA